MFGGKKEETAQVHRRAAAHLADRSARRLPDAVAGSTLRRRQSQAAPKATDYDYQHIPSRLAEGESPVRSSFVAWLPAYSRRAACHIAHARSGSRDLLARTCLAAARAHCGARHPCRSPPNERAAKIADFTLPNGLELVVIPDHRAPVVTHMIWYKVGAADETPGKSGLAHFLEHLMFKGTAKNPAGQFSQVVARIGGQENAFTSQRLHRLFPARAERTAQDGDGIRGRPHDRPAAHR